MVSKKGLIRKAKAEMTVDRPSYDFSLKPRPSRVRLHQENSDPFLVKVDVEHLGSACERERPVILSLDTDSLPSFVSYEFSPDSVIPPGKTTLSFKAASGEEIGTFKATLVGCCNDEDLEKTAEITVDVTFPPPPESISLGGEGPNFPQIEGTFKVDTRENILKLLQLPQEALEQTQKIEEDKRTKGYVEVSEEKVQRLKGFEAFFRPMDHVRSLLTFEPVSLRNTPFEGFRLEGGLPSGGYHDGKLTTVTRIFTTQTGAIIQLIESDLITSGGYSVYSKEAINENINGFPAVLVVEQSPSGNAVTSMLWTTTTTDYTLEMEGNVKTNGQYGLFLDLARSISK